MEQDYLKNIVNYDPLSGKFTWSIDRGRARRGKIVGSINSEGYRITKIDRVPYHLSRLAFLWMTGKWPKQLVDHVNGIRSDDRWSNLREANFQQNGANCRTKKKSGAKKGFSWIHTIEKYQARIRVNGKKICLGVYETSDEDHAAYVAAAKKYFGAFARA